MDMNRSREALAIFLDYLAEKGLVARATIHARKAAASQILGILDDQEATDVTQIDLDDLVARFARLHGQKYTPESLASYKSRLRSAIGDFTAYVNNPLAFKPSTQGRERSKTKAGRTVSAAPAAVQQESRAEAARASPTPMAAGNIMPIALRADLTIYIQGLPFDLTESEARKIAGVVTAMAQS